MLFPTAPLSTILPDAFEVRAFPLVSWFRLAILRLSVTVLAAVSAVLMPSRAPGAAAVVEALLVLLAVLPNNCPCGASCSLLLPVIPAFAAEATGGVVQVAVLLVDGSCAVFLRRQDLGNGLSSSRCAGWSQGCSRCSVLPPLPLRRVILEDRAGRSLALSQSRPWVSRRRSPAGWSRSHNARAAIGVLRATSESCRGTGVTWVTEPCSCPAST